MEKPVRPQFEQEYLKRKMQEQQKPVNAVINTTDNKENGEVQEHERKAGNSMEALIKVALAVGGVACAGAIIVGISTLNMTKENEVREATSIVQIKATDTTDKSNIEEKVDKTLQYQEEAEQFWDDSLICSKNEFINKYIQYREKGLTAEQAKNSLYNEFAKENQVEVNTDGEVVAETTEMDTLINSEDENITEEVVEQVDPEQTEITYEIKEVEPAKLYAIQQVNKRQGPSAQDFDKIGSLSYGEQVTVIGMVEEYKGETVLWYQLNTGEFVSGAYLVDQLPVHEKEQTQQQINDNKSNMQTPSSENNQTSNSNSDTMTKLNELMNSGEYNFNLEFTGQATANAGGAATGVHLE